MDKPSVEQVAWVFEKVAESIREGGGSFRHLIYDRMGFDEKAYIPLYKAAEWSSQTQFSILWTL